MIADRPTMEQYAQTRANETRHPYVVWQIPDTDIRGCACRDRVNTRTYTECGYARVRTYYPQKASAENEVTRT